MHTETGKNRDFWFFPLPQIFFKKVLAFYGYAVYNEFRCDVDSVEA